MTEHAQVEMHLFFEKEHCIANTFSPHAFVSFFENNLHVLHVKKLMLKKTAS